RESAVSIKTAPYGKWESPLRIEEVFARPSAPMYPCRHGGVLYWLESMAAEGGRMVLMRGDESGGVTCLTPEGFNIRSRVHEYGGKCFCLVSERLIFSNFSDGRLYRQRLTAGGEPLPLTPATGIAGQSACYADLEPAPDDRRLFCVAEIEQEGENSNALVALDLTAGDTAPVVVIEGNDFYASPVLSPDGKRLAWLEWSHPHMPWDESRLMTGLVKPDAANGVEIRDISTVAGGRGRSVCQPRFAPDGSLLFVMDADEAAEGAGFWNLYRWRNGSSEQLTRDEKEYGEPHWVFGEARYVFAGQDTLVGVRTAGEGDELVEVDLARKATRLLRAGFAGCSQFSAADKGGDGDGEMLFVAGYTDREPELVRLDPWSGEMKTLRGGARILAPEDTSRPRAIDYPTRDGGRAHAWFYPPANSKFEPPPDTLPPLVVMVHGGPTARAGSAFAPLKQYLTTLGYAVLDVNHRGSSGYGRRYRQALLGRWGEIDADDIADAVEFVAASGRVDGGKVFIRGGSAGGYAVLRALTRFPDLFCGGACYYGIGNLITLARLTHKFEASYTDALIGEVFDPQRAENSDSRYYRRSPLFFMDHLRSPLILFQGLDDKVVPPDLSREVVRTLERNGVVHEYVEYAGEGHGFRSVATRIDSLQREVAFYDKVIKRESTQ
ncbi:MAG: S9 family peptidase, partial [Pseudomonadota bacterium]|nr:S9 family peptidase [Pseudomonadota bacterium]